MSKTCEVSRISRSQNQDANKIQNIPFQNCRFFFSFDHKLHVGAASAKPKYNSPSINTFLISSASVLATVATWIFAFNEIAHAHAGISNLLMTRMLCHTSTAYMWKSVSYCGLVAIGSFRGVAYRYKAESLRLSNIIYSEGWFSLLLA